jgi:hypothetical protein
MSTFITLSNLPVVEIILRTLTFGATKSVWPTQVKKVIPAILISFEPG